MALRREREGGAMLLLCNSSGSGKDACFQSGFVASRSSCRSSSDWNCWLSCCHSSCVSFVDNVVGVLRGLCCRNRNEVGLPSNPTSDPPVFEL